MRTFNVISLKDWLLYLKRKSRAVSNWPVRNRTWKKGYIFWTWIYGAWDLGVIACRRRIDYPPDHTTQFQILEFGILWDWVRVSRIEPPRTDIFSVLKFAIFSFSLLPSSFILFNTFPFFHQHLQKPIRVLFRFLGGMGSQNILPNLEVEEGVL